jgi:hypothetical protein
MSHQEDPPVQVQEGVHLRQAGDEGILYDTAHRKVHVLNSTASFVWELCRESNSRLQISERLSQRFEVESAEARSDVDEILRIFTELELVLAG